MRLISTYQKHYCPEKNILSHLQLSYISSQRILLFFATAQKSKQLTLPLT